MGEKKKIKEKTKVGKGEKKTPHKATNSTAKNHAHGNILGQYSSTPMCVYMRRQKKKTNHAKAQKWHVKPHNAHL